MEKLIDIGPEDFINGISLGEHLPSKAVLSENTLGTCAVYNDYLKMGLMQAGPAANNTGSTVVVDTILAGAVNSSGGTNTLYTIGHSGHLYSLDTSSPDTTPTDHRSGTPITNPVNGLEVYQPTGGTRYLYYWQRTQIGRWNMSGSYPTGWTDNWQTGLQDTYEHPTHRFLDRIYYGNKDRIGMIGDDGGGAETHSSNVLDFPSDYEVKSITNDGYYLVVALSRQTVSGVSTQNVGAKIIFWDTVSSSWQKEWDLPDSTGIISIRHKNGRIYVLETNTLSVCSFGIPPTVVRNLAGGLRVSVNYGSTAANHQRMETYKDGVLWIDNDAALAHYGKLHPSLPDALNVPFSGFTSPSAILPMASTNRIFVGGASKFYPVPTSPSGTASANTTLNIETRYFDLKDSYDIERIDVIFGDVMESGDSVSVSVAAPSAVGSFTFGVASYATYGAVSKVTLTKTGQYGGFTKGIETVKLTLTGSQAPEIKRVIVYGNPNS